ncbi:hypothetical protein BGZ80_004112 [Entomortierella chlamydospora]|uniref:GRF-type domain-containing protein n=1 Tax=Entomortierella chlamydospora TaxID=101097 RepID=A0A9P6SW41_9FUNG|nr:hypothetical protein BGZ80_004112 [Entomortierella chlamydospora]
MSATPIHCHSLEPKVPKEPQTLSKLSSPGTGNGAGTAGCSEDEWDFKLATLISIFETTSEQVLQRALIDTQGDLEQAIPLILSINSSGNSSNSTGGSTPSVLSSSFSSSVYSRSSSLESLNSGKGDLPNRKKQKLIQPRFPEDVSKHCPCTLILNALDKDLATRLLKAMLIDAETWNRNRWWLFERMVESPHKTSYFAERDDDMEEVSGWTYNGMKQDKPKKFLPEMDEAKMVVRRIVNELRKSRDIGTARINITFRLRREGFSPTDTPVCKCGVAMVLRCVFKNQANYGRYFYMCYAAGSNEGRTCGAFHWVDMEEKLKLKKPAGDELEDDAMVADKECNSRSYLKRPCDSPQPEGENKSEETTGKVERHQTDVKDESELDLADELEDNDLENIPLEAIDEADLLD